MIAQPPIFFFLSSFFLFVHFPSTSASLFPNLDKQDQIFQKHHQNFLNHEKALQHDSSFQHERLPFNAPKHLSRPSKEKLSSSSNNHPEVNTRAHSPDADEPFEIPVVVGLSYHKSGTILLKKLLLGLGLCLNQEVSKGVGFHENGFTLNVPPYLFRLEDFEKWPALRYQDQLLTPEKAKQLNVPVHYLHFVRNPLDMIISGYFYHLMAHEVWLHRDRTPTMLCLRLGLTTNAIAAVNHFDRPFLKDFTQNVANKCFRLMAKYEDILGQRTTYQRILHVASFNDGLFFELVRSLPTLFRMYTNLYTEPEGTFRYFTDSLPPSPFSSSSLATQLAIPPNEAALMNKLLSLFKIDRYPSLLASCHSNITMTMTAPHKEHGTASLATPMKKKAATDVILGDDVAGEMIARLVALVMAKREE
jgi:hypothetical protein